MNATQIRDKMEKLKDYISDADNSVRDGRMVDLSGLDKEVAVICTQAIALPANEAHDLQPVMAELIGNLERLSTSLKDFKDNVRKK